MVGGADARGGGRNLSRLCLGKCDQLLHRLRRQPCIDDQNERAGGNERDRIQIAYRIETHVLVDARQYRNGRAGAEHGVAVRLRSHDEFGADHGARTRAIVHDHLVAPNFGEAAGDRSTHQIDRPARREGIDHTHRPVRKVRLRLYAGPPAEHRRCARRVRDRGQPQFISIFHDGSLTCI